MEKGFFGGLHIRNGFVIFSLDTYLFGENGFHGAERISLHGKLGAKLADDLRVAKLFIFCLNFAFFTKDQRLCTIRITMLIKATRTD